MVLLYHQFIHLRSLSLYGINFRQITSPILSELCHLSSLVRLSFEQCSFPYDSQSIINTIWSLPNLTQCSIENDSELESCIVSPTVISSTIRCFSVRSIRLSKNGLAGLFQYTPNLRHFSVNVQFDLPCGNLSSPFESMRTLDMSLFQVNSTILMSFLKQLPNLYRLKLSTSYCYIYGQQWEQTIKNHLPQLNTFQFRMKSAFDKEKNCEERIDEILDSFRNQFWLNEHRWFVRCDWSPDYGKMVLYTVPYAFNDFSCEYSVISKSTYPHKKNRRLYDSVHRVTYKPRLSKWSIRSQIQFFNIQKIFIQFPINDYFYSMIPRLDQLTLLDVSSNDRSSQSNTQLQILLDRASNLRSLRYHIWPSSEITHMPPFESKSASIYQLDLRYMSRCYNKEHCIAMSRSPLGIQCEILSIVVENRACIFDLVNTMNNLRTLYVTYSDKNTWRVWSSSKDELIEKLHWHVAPRSIFDSDESDVYDH